MEPNKKLIARATKQLLVALGADTESDGLYMTPDRVAKFYIEFMTKDKYNFTVFDSEGYDEMIIQKDIPFFSLCEHHLVPFFGHAHVGYIPKDKIVGLSKLARTVRHHAQALQNQERLTSQVSETLNKALSPDGVAVVIEARHLCMEMRGVKTHDVYTTTSKLTGSFKSDHATRAEFMKLINGR